MSLEIGSVLSDRYRIDGLLGEGGMGAVYRAFDLRLNLTVAVKESLEDPTGRLHRSTDPQAKVQIEKARERFKQEAEVLARLKHPGLPAVRDHFIIRGEGQFLVMELVEGQDLQVLLKQAGRLSEERVIEIGLQMCDVLKYLHSQIPPVIHRDIKPANLRMTPEGKVILVDFGICKEGIGQATKTAARAVSEGFSPIEMYGQYGGTDARSDIYSLGATLLALFTGEALPSPTDRTLGHLLPQLLPTTSNKTTKLHAILEQALALKPEDRYQSAQEMQDALKNLNIENVQVLAALKSATGSHTSGKRTREVREESGEQTSVQGKTSGSKKWLIVAGGLSVVLVAALLAVYLSQRPQTSINPGQPDVIKQNQTGQDADSVARAGDQRSTTAEQKTEAQTKSLVTFTLNTEAKVRVIGQGEKTGKRVEFTLSKGEYKYSVTAKGFRDETGTLQVDAGHDREILLSLQAAEENNQAKQAGRQPTVDTTRSQGPAKTDKKSKVTFEINTPATVEIEGIESQTGSRIYFELSPGTYRYSVTATGRDTKRDSVSVAENTQQNIAISLKSQKLAFVLSVSNIRKKCKVIVQFGEGSEFEFPNLGGEMTEVRKPVFGPSMSRVKLTFKDYSRKESAPAVTLLEESLEELYTKLEDGFIVCFDSGDDVMLRLVTDIVGRWDGIISLPDVELQISISFFRSGGDSYGGTIDIPTQKAKGIPLNNILLRNDEISFGMSTVPGKPLFRGEFRDNGHSIEGSFSQGGEKGDFTITRVE